MPEIVKIEGLDGVLDAMAKLEDKVQKRAMSHALREGAKVFQQAARNNAKRFDDPATIENISRDIKTRALKKKQMRGTGADMGMGVGVVDTHGFYHYAWFLEEGTSHTRAQPFMRPAFESEHVAALDAVVRDLQQAIFGR